MDWSSLFQLMICSCSVIALFYKKSQRNRRTSNSSILSLPETHGEFGRSDHSVFRKQGRKHKLVFRSLRTGKRRIEQSPEDERGTECRKHKTNSPGKPGPVGRLALRPAIRRKGIPRRTGGKIPQAEFYATGTGWLGYSDQAGNSGITSSDTGIGVEGKRPVKIFFRFPSFLP